MGQSIMSSLNLVPNPTVMAVQAGIFLANFVVAKKLILEPYLRVHRQRTKLTDGSKAEAADIIKKNDETAVEIKQQIKSATQEAEEIRSELTNKASEAKRRLISEAEETARNALEEAERVVSESLSTEKAKIPSMIKELSETIVQQVLKA